jgi:hypothetical protein
MIRGLDSTSRSKEKIETREIEHMERILSALEERLRPGPAAAAIVLRERIAAGKKGVSKKQLAEIRSDIEAIRKDLEEQGVVIPALEQPSSQAEPAATPPASSDAAPPASGTPATNPLPRRGRVERIDHRRGLETIREMFPMVEELLKANELVVSHEDYLAPGGLYADSLDVKRQVDRAREKEEGYVVDAASEFASFIESILVLFAAQMDWMGEGTIAERAARPDDQFKATDGVFYFTHGVPHILAFNSTSSFRSAREKILKFLPFIYRGTLGERMFSKISSKVFGVTMEGRQLNVPRAIIVMSWKIAGEIAELMKANDFEKLAVHPAQLMILKQLQVQVHAFHQYAVFNVADRGARDEGKDAVLPIYNRLRQTLDAIYAEREAFLEIHKKHSPRDDIRRMLERGVKDKEHEKLLALFEGTGRTDRIHRVLREQLEEKWREMRERHSDDST